MDITLSVDALSPKINGIPRYNWELVRGLSAHPDISSITFYCHGQWIADPLLLLQGPLRRKRWQLPRRLRGVLARRQLARRLYHGPNFFLPEGVRDAVVTVHDLSIYLHPETHPEFRKADFRREFEQSMARASHIITDTETVRQELIAYFGVDGDRVTAVPLGVDHIYSPVAATELRQPLSKYGLSPGSYGLCVSTIEPRKGIMQLLRAWSGIDVALRTRFPLVLVGGEGWLNDEIHQLIDQFAAEGWVRYLGYIDEGDLPAIYAGAALFAYPSIYEGFGLPPVEAMASGIPVIASNRSCMPEVLGDAAALVDPDDHYAFVLAIENGLTNEEWRQSIRIKGLQRAASYSWKRCIDETVAVYRQIWDARLSRHCKG